MQSHMNVKFIILYNDTTVKDPDKTEVCISWICSIFNYHLFVNIFM